FRRRRVRFSGGVAERRGDPGGRSFAGPGIGGSFPGWAPALRVDTSRFAYSHAAGPRAYFFLPRARFTGYKFFPEYSPDIRDRLLFLCLAFFSCARKFR